MSQAVEAPDERAVRAHLAEARFQVGVDDGRWRLLGIDWPTVLVAIRAAPRPSAPEEFFLRVTLDGYPQRAPWFMPWDPVTEECLGPAGRPKGEYVGAVFRSDDWEQGRALYAAWDRVALEGHSDWVAKHARTSWTAERDLAFALALISDLLTSDDYNGV